jgi:hypothetical protein
MPREGRAFVGSLNAIRASQRSRTAQVDPVAGARSIHTSVKDKEKMILGDLQETVERNHRVPEGRDLDTKLEAWLNAA